MRIFRLSQEEVARSSGDQSSMDMMGLKIQRKGRSGGGGRTEGN